MPRVHSRDAILQRLKEVRPAILPSMLLCDFANLEREVRLLEECGVQVLHLDVMDGQFVPNFTYGMTIVEAVRKSTKLIIDVHLMMLSPEKYLKQFVEAGADCLTFHVEATNDSADLINRIKNFDIVAGVAINPSTPFTKLDESVVGADMVLVMSVEAGFGGQSFNPIAIERLKQLRERLGSELLLEVDGGIGVSTLPACRQAGADLFVVGSAIFRQADYRRAIADLEAACFQANV